MTSAAAISKSSCSPRSCKPCEPNHANRSQSKPKRFKPNHGFHVLFFFYGSTHLKTTHRLNYNIMERSRWIHRTCLDRWYLHAMPWATLATVTSTLNWTTRTSMKRPWWHMRRPCDRCHMRRRHFELFISTAFVAFDPRPSETIEIRGRFSCVLLYNSVFLCSFGSDSDPYDMRRKPYIDG